MPDIDSDEDLPQGQSAYRRLLDQIRRGELQPGTRLREIELSERLNISRTPVREALRLLEADGLVAHLPRLGTTVRKLDYAEIMEIYEMRAVLEGTAARLAARSASDVEIAELRAVNAEFAAAQRSPSGALEINRQFHRAMQDAAKNRYLVRAIGAIEKTLLILGPTTLRDADRAEAAVAEHDRILDAIELHDGPRAETEMRAHIEAAQRARLKALRHQARPQEEDGE
jgi:DNA-binding GntR family transcriptional regulator